MDVEELLAEIEPLAYGDRCRRLAALRGDADAAGLVRALAARGHYERGVALDIAAASLDLAAIAGAMRDPDAGLAARAVGLAARLGVADTEFADLLADAPAALRAAVYRAIRRHSRTALAERLLDQVADRWGQAEAAALLPVCGPGMLRLGDLGHALPNTASLARAHPGPLLDLAERALAAEPDTSRAWGRYAPGIAVAVAHDPARVVGLLERYWRTGPVPSALTGRVGRLLEAEPDRTLALLLAPDHIRAFQALVRRRSVRRRLVRLGADDLATVARAVREDDGALRDLLRSLPPSRRGAFFDAAMSGVDRTAAMVSESLLDVLPTSVRVREARRMLGLRRVADHPGEVRRVTALLPFEEAEPVLRPLTRRSEASERAGGYRLLIQCAGRSRDPRVLTTLLESFGRLRNEQDPVRYEVVSALSRLPQTMIEPIHAAALAQITDDALAARDLSWSTKYALTGVAELVFRQGAVRGDADLLVFALDTVTKLVGHSGYVQVSGLRRELRRGQEYELARALAGHLEAASRRDDHGLALTLSGALGRRGRDVPELQRALEAALDSPSDRVSRTAIAHWLESPRTRAERVERLVRRDPSTVTLSPVFAALARTRTDLLDVVLSGRAPVGRFHRGDVLYVPVARTSWTRRWTGRQRAAYITLLHRLARAGNPKEDRGAAIRALSGVPGLDPAELAPYLRAQDALLRRMAITALPWTGAPQRVLTDLLDLSGSDDAHTAVQSAGRAARYVRPSALPDALGPVLATGKVTARKEALRLLVHHHAPGAMEILAAAWAEPGQHPDVRAAIVSTARQHLAAPVALRILTEAAEGPRDVARQVIGAVPGLVEDRFRETYAALVLQVARSSDPETRDAALPALPAWAPWDSRIPALLADLVTDPAEPWRPALTALIDCAATGLGLPELARAATTLTTHAAHPPSPAADPHPISSPAPPARLNDTDDPTPHSSHPAHQGASPGGPEPEAEREHHDTDDPAPHGSGPAHQGASPGGWEPEAEREHNTDAPAPHGSGASRGGWEAEAEAERDRPAAQRLRALVGLVRERALRDRDGLEAALRALDGRLPEPRAAELAAATLRWDRLETGGELDALADRSLGGVLATLPVADFLAGPPGAGTEPEPAIVLPHAVRLGARGDLAGGLFATVLTRHHGPRAGWPPPWRDLLRRLRAHPEPDVAYVAAGVYTADE